MPEKIPVPSLNTVNDFIWLYPILSSRDAYLHIEN